MKFLSYFFCITAVAILTTTSVKASSEHPDNKTPLKSFNAQLHSTEYAGITSLVVAQGGEVIFEEYFEGTDENTLHNTRSLTKTLVAILTGIAIEKGHLTSEQKTIFDLFKDKIDINTIDKRKRAITFEDMLTMSSILECDDENMFSRGHEERMYIVEDWAKFTLDLPIKGFPNWVTKPEDSPYGRAFSYCTAQSVLLGIALHRATEQNLSDFAQTHLLSLLNINEVDWQYTPTGEVSMAGGVGFSSRSLLKLGQLLLDDGKFEGNQVISAAWVNKMLTEYAEPRENHAYGYQIWQMPFSHKGSDIKAWSMAGNGGNYVLIVPELELVTVITSTNYNSRHGHPRSQKLFQDVVLRSIE